MTYTIPSLILGLTLGLPALAADMGTAEHGGMNHANMGQTNMNRGAMSAMLSEGMVRKVDKAQGKLTIRHGPLENLGMPAMTMVFRVKDPAWLDQVKAGNNIRFLADRVNGQLTVTRLEIVQ